MEPKRDLTDKELGKLAPADRGKRKYRWDAQVRGFGVRVTDRARTDNPKLAAAISFVLVTRFPGSKNPAPRQIGEYPTMTLAAARTKAREWIEDIQRGIDPKEKVEGVRRAAEAARRDVERKAENTFERAFAAYEEERLSKLRSGKVVAGVIAKHVSPALGNRPLADITRAEANELLKRIAKATPTHARRIRSYLRTFGTWAEDDERIEESPFANLRRLGKENARERVLTDDEIRAVWRASMGLGAFGRAFRLMLLTGQRRSEVGEMEWREIDDSKGLWTLPRERVKADREHEVPLSGLATQILAECKKIGPHVFATRAPRARAGEPQGKATAPLSGWSKAKARLDVLALAELRKLTGDEAAEFPEWHLHDLRRTCATNLARLRIERVVISKVLNHAEGGVTKIYARFGYEPEKRRALDAWASRLSEIVDGQPARNVIAFPGRG